MTESTAQTVEPDAWVETPAAPLNQSVALRPQADVLVYDVSADGHRANYVRIFADVASGSGAIGRLRDNIGALLTARHLVLPTFESAPKRFALVALVRALLGKRTALVLLRAHLVAHRSPLNRLLHSFTLGALAASRAILLMSIVPIARGRVEPIEDPEFWDLTDEQLCSSASPLADRVAKRANGRTVLLMTGVLELPKGLGTLRDIYATDARLIERLYPVLAGAIEPDARRACQELEAMGAHVEGRRLSDEELLSLFRVADAVWCCYAPSRDMSSGVFGRAIQFGAAPVVRKGSYLESFASFPSNGVALDPCDCAEAARTLSAWQPQRLTEQCRRHEHSKRVRRLLADHFALGD